MARKVGDFWKAAKKNLDNPRSFVSAFSQGFGNFEFLPKSLGNRFSSRNRVWFLTGPLWSDRCFIWSIFIPHSWVSLGSIYISIVARLAVSLKRLNFAFAISWQILKMNFFSCKQERPMLLRFFACDGAAREATDSMLINYLVKTHCKNVILQHI